IILFLRTGWVVGQAGFYGALIIILIANAISFFTGLSLSAIATSMDVKAGGNYYLISRSLGLEIGGAIGIPLYMSQAISVAFYIIGFTEAMASFELVAALDPRIVATVVAAVFVVVAYVGADFALKIQYFILAILVLALISFFTGGWGETIEPNLVPRYSEGVSFWVVFAVFFPAVTGIEVGISLSGDLKDPSKSIPLGTITSILVTSVVYIAAALWFSYQLPADELIANPYSMQEIASVPALILAGVAASTLSSALGSVLAAPRTLQAVARDRVVPRWIASNLGSPTEPRMAVLITGALAVTVIWMGDLDFVAPIITMFFLNTYGMVNLVGAIERMVGNPSFRPRLRVPLWISLLGAIGCYGAMFLIHAPATVGAILVSYGIFFALSRRSMGSSWGDVRNGIWTSLARYALLNLEREPEVADVRNWRPNLLVFTGQPHNREELARMSEWLGRGRGIVTFTQLITGAVEQPNKPVLRETAQQRIRDYIRDRRMAAFAEAQIVPDFARGAVSIVQAHGIGQLESNSVLMGWSRTPEGRVTLLRVMRDMTELSKSTMFLHVDERRGFGDRASIDVWWGGRGGNADLMLLLAHVIRLHGAWGGSEIRVLRVVDSEEGVEPSRRHMETLLEDVRVDASPEIIVRRGSDRPIAELIAAHSGATDLTLIGMQKPDADRVEAYGHRLHELVEAVGTVLLVHNGQPRKDLLGAE
ncbi:MAG: amino acid permease, partial [Gemmatimonadota bacterium]